jgi:pyruvate/2-oxoglutarate/acetoin dehydrogenase E1 component
VLAEADIHRPFARVATTGIIPYARHLERQTLPSVDRILGAARRLVSGDLSRSG